MELIYDENEQIAERKSDTNKDCRFDETVYYIDGVAERAERDTDFDGRTDVWTFFAEDGKTPARQDQDTNRDGEKDRFITFRDGTPSIQLDGISDASWTRWARAPRLAASSTSRLLFDDSGAPTTITTSARAVSSATAFWRFWVA